MKITKLIPLTIAITAILFTTACKKDGADVAGGTRLSKLVFNAGMDSTGSLIFEYDNNGRLELVTTILHGSPYYTTRLFYKADGKLEKTEHTNVGWNQTSTNSYHYENSYIVKKQHEYGQGYDFFNRYTYNAQGQLIADTVRNSGIPAYYTTFSYTGDNLTQWQYFNKSQTGMDWIPGGVTKATYTNSDNALYEAGIMHHITLGDFLGGIVLLSKQLVATVEDPYGHTYIYSYDFYSDGLIKQAIIRLSNRPNDVQTIDFYYE